MSSNINPENKLSPLWNVVKDSSASDSFNKIGKVISKGRKGTRLEIPGIKDERLLIAIKETKFTSDGKVYRSSFDKWEYIPLKSDNSNQSPILVSITSLSTRLHLSKEEIYKAVDKDSGLLNFEFINNRAIEVKKTLDEYDELMHLSAQIKSTIKVSDKEITNIIRTAVTQDVSKEINIGNVTILTFREAGKLHLGVEGVEIGNGAFANVKEVANISSSTLRLVTKTANVKEPLAAAQIDNEVIKLEYLWKGQVHIPGIQPPPKGVFNYTKGLFNDTQKGYIIQRHDGDLKYQMVKNKKGAIFQSDITTRLKGATQLLEGLAFMKSKGLLHGDIKPENIGCVINNEKNPDEPSFEFYFADFGDAKFIENENNELNIFNQKSLEKHVGNSTSVEYLCSETQLALMRVAKKGYEAHQNGNIQEAETYAEEYRALQYARDVYSTGLTLYTLLVKERPPFDENGILDTSKVKANLLKVAVTEEAAEAIKNMTISDPKERISVEKVLEIFNKNNVKA